MAKYELGHTGGSGRAGSRNKAYAQYDAIGRQSMEKAVRAVGQAAAEGDPRAARLLFGRLWPQATDQSVHLDLPPLEKPADLIAAYASLMTAIANSDVTPGQGAKIAQVLEGKRLAIETASHEPRITALEEKRGLKPAAS